MQTDNLSIKWKKCICNRSVINILNVYWYHWFLWTYSASWTGELATAYRKHIHSMQETYPLNAEGKVNGRILLFVQFVQWVGFLFFMVWGVVPRSPLHIVIENFDYVHVCEWRKYLKCVLVLLIFMIIQGWKHWRTSDIRQTTCPLNERNILHWSVIHIPKVYWYYLFLWTYRARRTGELAGADAKHIH